MKPDAPRNGGAPFNAGVRRLKVYRERTHGADVCERGRL